MANTSANPHALLVAQDDAESFEVMRSPPSNFDMYTDRPLSAGYTKARKDVHKDGDWHRSVHVWIIDPFRRQVVLQQRSSSKDTFPNRWDISAAGHIESGASSKETAIRELTEELGIESKNMTFAFTCAAEQSSLGGCNCYEDVYFLLMEKDTCTFALGTSEVSGAKWFDIDELRIQWERDNSKYVPRVQHYRQAFFKHTEALIG